MRIASNTKLLIICFKLITSLWHLCYLSSWPLPERLSHRATLYTASIFDLHFLVAIVSIPLITLLHQPTVQCYHIRYRATCNAISYTCQQFSPADVFKQTFNARNPLQPICRRICHLLNSFQINVMHSVRVSSHVTVECIFRHLL